MPDDDWKVDAFDVKMCDNRSVIIAFALGVDCDAELVLVINLRESIGSELITIYPVLGF